MKTARTRLLLIATVAAIGVAPAASITRRALADDGAQQDEGADQDDDKPQPKQHASKIDKKRKAVLRALATDESALINVTAREMPSSPDVLNLGRKSAKAVARCVSDNVDDGARVLCAELLGKLGDRAGLAALQGALEAWNPQVRGAAIRALASMPDPSSFEPLVKIVDREDEDEANRSAALLTLGALSDPRAMKAVRTEFHRKDDNHRLEDGADAENKRPDLRSVAFKALWKSRHLMARSTLVGDVKDALASSDPSIVLAGTFAASELRATELRDPLIHLMTNPDARVRNRAVYAVGKIGDKAATSALLAFVPKVRESRMLNNIAFALERLDSAAFFATARELSTNSQAQIRMNTAFVLGDVKRPEGLPMLKAALDDKNAMVRTSAVRAIGQIDSKGSAALLERFVDDPTPTLQRAAIYAIFALEGLRRADLVRSKIYSDGKLADKLEAAIVLGKAGDPGVTGDLMSCLEARTCELSAIDAFMRKATAPEVPGRTLLAWAKGRSELTDLVSVLKPAGGGTLAISDVQASVAQGAFGRARVSLDLAGDLGDAQATAVLKPLLAHENARLRMHAAIALARKGDAEAARVLLVDLDNLSHQRLPEMARAMGRVTEPQARALLGPELLKREQGADRSLAMAAAAVRFAWEPEQGIFPMLDGLAARTRIERELAELYVRRDKRPVVTSLLRRALAREKRPDMQGTLRRLLDVRDARDSAQ